MLTGFFSTDIDEENSKKDRVHITKTNVIKFKDIPVCEKKDVSKTKPSAPKLYQVPPSMPTKTRPKLVTFELKKSIQNFMEKDLSHFSTNVCDMDAAKAFYRKKKSHVHKSEKKVKKDPPSSQEEQSGSENEGGDDDDDDRGGGVDLVFDDDDDADDTDSEDDGKDISEEELDKRIQNGKILVHGIHLRGVFNPFPFHLCAHIQGVRPRMSLGNQSCVVGMREMGDAYQSCAFKLYTTSKEDRELNLMFARINLKAWSDRIVNDELSIPMDDEFVVLISYMVANDYCPPKEKAGMELKLKGLSVTTPFLIITKVEFDMFAKEIKLYQDRLPMFNGCSIVVDWFRPGCLLNEQNSLKNHYLCTGHTGGHTDFSSMVKTVQMRAGFDVLIDYSFL